MTPNQIDIIKREVATRLPYGVMVKYDLGDSYPYPKIGRVYLWHKNGFCNIYMVDKYPENWFLPIKSEIAHWNEIKPYLRPMSSMTDKEKSEYEMLVGTMADTGVSFLIDWLNEYMFDYRGLIPMNLALTAPEDMYDFSNTDESCNK